MPKRIFSKDLLNEVVLQVAKSWQTREGGVLKAILHACYTAVQFMFLLLRPNMLGIEHDF